MGIVRARDDSCNNAANMSGHGTAVARHLLRQRDIQREERVAEVVRAVGIELVDGLVDVGPGTIRATTPLNCRASSRLNV